MYMLVYNKACLNAIRTIANFRQNHLNILSMSIDASLSSNRPVFVGDKRPSFCKASPLQSRKALIKSRIPSTQTTWELIHVICIWALAFRPKTNLSDHLVMKMQMMSSNARSDSDGTWPDQIQAAANRKTMDWSRVRFNRIHNGFNESLQNFTLVLPVLNNSKKITLFRVF